MTTKRSQQKVRKPIVYPAGPLGFSEVGRFFHNGMMIPMLERVGCMVLDPWKLTSQDLIDAVQKMPFGPKKRAAWKKLNVVIYENNEAALNECHVVAANLDGADVDSGTCEEIGFVFALGKRIEGYRGDFRMSCDNIGGIINLQVEGAIRKSGGDIVSTLAELEERMAAFVEDFHKKMK